MSKSWSWSWSWISKSWIQVCYLPDFDCRNDQHLKMSHDHLGSWPVCFTVGLSDILGAKLPGPCLWPPFSACWQLSRSLRFAGTTIHKHQNREGGNGICVLLNNFRGGHDRKNLPQYFGFDCHLPHDGLWWLLRGFFFTASRNNISSC